jgi:exopolysaccharide production protein ExoQ
MRSTAKTLTKFELSIIEPHLPVEKPSLRVSPEIMAFLFWFVLSIMPLNSVFLFRDNPVTGTLASGLIVCLAAYSIATCVLAAPRVRAQARLGPSAVILVIFATWVGASLLWTGASSRFTALAYYAVEIMSLISVFLLCFWGGSDRVLRSSLQGFCVATAIVILTLIVFGIRNEEGRLGDHFLHPNSLGRRSVLAAASCFYLIGSLDKSSRNAFATYVMMLILSAGVFLSLSKTSILTFFIVLGMMQLSMKISMQKKATIFVFVIIVAAVSASSIMEYLNYYLEYSNGESLYTLTGRTMIWRDTWTMIQQQFWIGYGLLAFRDLGPQIAAVRLVHAHNEWLQIWFSYGLIGLLLAVGFYLSFLYQAGRALTRTSTRSLGSLALGIAICGLVFGISEASVTTLILPVELILLLAMALSATKRSVDRYSLD